MNYVTRLRRAGAELRRGILVASLGALWLTPAVPAGAAPRQVLHGQVPDALARLNLQPLERLPGTNRLNLAIGLPGRNPQALSQLLQQLYDPASTNFHQFLTPERFTEAYGPAETDYQAVLDFARAHGLDVTAADPNRRLVDVSASVVEIEAAFHVVLQVYQHPTEQRTFYAPDVEPSLDLAVPILGVSGLNNYSLPHPRVQATPITEGQQATPQAGAGPNGTFMGNDFRAAYLPGSSVAGSGQTVGLLQFDGYTPNDIAYYESKAGLPSVTLSNVLLDGFNGRPSGSGGEVEVSLDIEMSISMAPGLSQVIVYMAGPAGNWHDILNRMASDNLAKQLSCSWYIPGGKADPVADLIFQQMAAQGQGFFNASGDYDAYSGPIDFPGDTPYLTQVGGTTLTTTGPGGPWVSEKVWNVGGTSGVGSAGGVSTSYPIPSYQTNIDMKANQGSTTQRNIPDVALTADNVYVRADGQDYNVGGTSCAAPLWAGFSALINQVALANGAPVVGFVNPAVYALGKSGTLTANFHDITTGNNESPTSPTKFVAVPGYDLCTGWGTPLGTNLLYSIGVPEPLRIAPGSDLLFTGPVGGPLAPATQTYSLTNKSGPALNWSVSKDATWLSVSPTNGTLTPGGPATNVTVKLTGLAAGLAAGSYTATLSFSNLSDGFCQTRHVTLDIVTPPLITAQPLSQAVLQGSTTSFTVGTASNALQYYQWQLDNGSYQTNLTDGGSLSGSGAATLTVSNVAPANVGAYSVVITNAAGSATSAVAYLSIIPWRPVITMQPASQTILPGATTTFTVAVVGTPPFSYRWQKGGSSLADGGAILGSGTATLTVTNATLANVGTYSVLISNSLGTATSAGAGLSLVSVTAAGVALDTLYSFGAGNIGYGPYAGLVQAQDGNFYGTALEGGVNGDGTVFRMTTNGGVSLVHAFNYNTDGAVPYAQLMQASSGSLYGANYIGGSSGYGTLFRMTTNGSTLTLSALNYTTGGGYPVAGMVQGRDGNFYAPVLQGGLSGYGTLFRVTAGNGVSTLRSFNGENGAYSSSVLLQGADGNFYGTAEDGGTNGGYGTVYRATPAGVITPVVSFAYTNGGIPVAGLVQDTDGTFYGTTYYGGTNGAGSIFKMTADGTLTSLYSFSGEDDGGNPFGGLLLSRDGNLYGTTESGGAYNSGTVFRMSPDGTFGTLAHFDGFQGAAPESTLVQGSDGNLYGTTFSGGQGNDGALFRLSINSALQITHQPQNQTAFLGDTVAFNVASFGSLPVTYQWRKNGRNLTDAGNLSGSTTRTLTLTNIGIADPAVYSVVVSNAYGAVTSSGARLEVIVSPPYIVSGPDDQTVLVGATATFNVDAEGDGPLYFQWQQNGTNLTDGGNILGSATSTLTLANVTAASAGTYSVIVSNSLDYLTSDGAVLTVVPVLQPGSVLYSLHSFSGASVGLNPYAGVIQGRDQYLYGTTLAGGSLGYGTAFRLALGGAFTVLHSFTNGVDGAEPYAGLVQGSDGNFYGAAFQGGADSAGALFKMNPAGIITPLYAFQGGDDGSYPVGTLIQGSDGKLYGTAYQGGSNSDGSVFSLTTSGSFAPLASFAQDDGAIPLAGLVQSTNGLFYGVTYLGGDNDYGTVFSLATNGTLTTMVSFNYTNGAYPLGPLIQTADGAFYGTTAEGGTNGGWGTVFRLTADGTLTTVYSFGYNDGATPAAGLATATDGNLYGTTSEGGWGGLGSVFRLATNGVLTTVVWFNGANGANPQSPVIQARDGSFCGTTEYGGVNYNGAAYTGEGLVYRLILPMFLSNPFTQAVATVSLPYAGSLNFNCIRPGGDTVQFAKLSGPAWLNVAADGTLSGTPTVPDIGTNTFTVSLSDAGGWSSAATMFITVLPSPWITASLVRQGPNFALTWSGRTAPYQVQMATNLVNPNWVTITAPLYTNSLALTPVGTAYYRIVGQ